MEKIFIDVLNKWAKYSNYNEEQKMFNLLSYELDMYNQTKRVQGIVNNYDETGLLAVENVKKLFLEMIRNGKVSVYDIITNKDSIKEEVDMYNAFFCKEILEAEKRYVGVIDALCQKITSKKLIGKNGISDSFIEKVFSFTSSVITALEKCDYETYKTGGEVGEITKISTSIHIFPSLADCLFALGQAEDGLYLCYIDISHSADSYFGFFLKSNGNIFSVNDRIDESFRGAHRGSRNARWVEGKATDIFPYEYIFSFDDADYKGYWHSYMIDEDKLSVFNLDEDVYLPILLGMILTIGRFKGKKVDDKVVYVDSLLPINIPLLSSDKNELMVINNNEIVEAHKALDLSFDMDKIMDGSAIDEFQTEDISYKSHVVGENKGQIFVDLYGEGFQIKPDIFSTQKLLEMLKDEEGDSLSRDDLVDYVPEFVGEKTRMRALAYSEIRKQLADYINKKMFEEYNSFGGVMAVRDWFHKSIIDNMTTIEEYIAQKYYSIQDRKKQIPNGWWPTNSEAKFIINYEQGRIEGFYSYYMVNKNNNWDMDAIDMRTGAKCSEFFIIRPVDYIGLEMLLGELPKIVKGWHHNGHDSAGNRLINAHDAVETVGTPFENWPSKREPYKSLQENTYMDFMFAIGYSKRGLKQMLKEHPRKELPAEADDSAESYEARLI